jgi:hypothetical protein
MQRSATLPGIYFEPQRPVEEGEPLRTDIAGMAGETRRGPVDEAVRLDGWPEFQAVFGVPAKGLDLPLAARGYFENGGEIGYAIRVLGKPYAAATGKWVVGRVDPVTGAWQPGAPSAGRFEASEFEIAATSPGTWGNGIEVDFTYVRIGFDGAPQIDIVVHCPQEPPEYLTGIPADRLTEEVAARSRFIRLQKMQAAPPPVPNSGPLRIEWDTVTLAGGLQRAPLAVDYLRAAATLNEQREVALLAYPDLHRMTGGEQAQLNVLARSIATADSSLDRQVLTAPPLELDSAPALAAWLTVTRETLGDEMARSVTIYHPWLRVEDPAGGLDAPYRLIPPMGHIGGVISRLDRERGAHYTPANALLFDAVDAAAGYPAAEQALLLASGFNLIRCQSGQGLQVWGGRTAAHPRRNPEGVFLAHRRLIHRLVRAIRRVAEPLVFDNHDVELRLTIVRTITGVLLEAFRAGALKGTREEEGFQVRCDESNNPPEEEDLGRVLCEIALAPAVPMEFIILRVAFTEEGRLEVIET